MKFEEDYVMRMIKDMVKALACVVFGKRFTEYEVEEEKADDTDFLYRDIIEMADRGKINEAENILLTDMDRTDKRYMDKTMEEISAMVGFANRQSFYAAFYKILGVTPRGYRMEHLAKEKETGQRHWNPKQLETQN